MTPSPPLRVTAPPWAARSPAMIRSRVVLPVPFGPTSATVAPSPTRRLTSSSSGLPSGREKRTALTSTCPTTNQCGVRPRAGHPTFGRRCEARADERAGSAPVRERAHGPRLPGPRSELVVGRVSDLFQGEAVRRDDADRRVADARGQHPRGPLDVAPALTHRQ